MHDALASGAWQALVHDELEAVDAADRYDNVMARLGQLSHLGIAVGAGIAFVALRGGSGFAALGWTTVTLNLLATGLVATRPDCRRVTSSPDDPESGEGWWATLRAGVAEATRTPVIGRLVLLVALLGGEVSARWHRPNPRWLGLGLVGSMIITALAFITDAVWSFGLVAVGYAAFGGSSMSTLMFVVIAVLADGDDPSPGILIAVAGLAVAGWLVALWLPSARPFDSMLEGDLR